MKQHLIIIASFLLLIFQSCTADQNYAPTEQLSTKEIQQLKYSLSRYYAALPKKSTHQNKFDTQYDTYYRQESDLHELVYYKKDSDSDFQYFMFTRIAPSLKVKKVAIAGRFIENNGKIIHYEEKFRTWKMEEKELKDKTSKLFRLYVEGKDLSEYETKNSAPEFWIEFPDDRNTFDAKQKRWIYK